MTSPPSRRADQLEPQATVTRCELCGTPVRVLTSSDGTSHYKPLSEPHCPDAYVAPLNGGREGYQARCWGCDWEGPERPAGRDGKRRAREDARTHA